MLRVQAPDVIIPGTPDEIFEVYADGRRYAEWMPGAADMRLLSGEPIGVGSTFSGTFAGAGKVRWEILEFERPRRQLHLGHTPVGDMRHIIGFEAAPGGTRLTQRGEGELKGFFRVLGPLMKPLVRRMMARNWEKTALALKQHRDAQRAQGASPSEQAGGNPTG